MPTPRSTRSIHSAYFCVTWLPQDRDEELRVEAHVYAVGDRWIIMTIWPDQYEEFEAVTDDIALCERLNSLHVTLRNHNWSSVAGPVAPEDATGQCPVHVGHQNGTVQGPDDSCVLPWDVEIGRPI